MKLPASLRNTGTLSLVLLSFFLLCGDTAPQSCQGQRIGPSGAEVVGAAVAVGAVIMVGTVVLVHVHNNGHRLKGCITAGPSGLQLTTDDHKIYSLGGDMKDVKPGDKVQIYGNKIKKAKGSTQDPTFTVEKLNKDYGPCTITPTNP